MSLSLYALLQRKKLEVDEFFDPKKIRVIMGAMFLKAWTYVAENEHTFDLPLLIHYSSIDKVSSYRSDSLQLPQKEVWAYNLVRQPVHYTYPIRACL